MTIRKAIQWLEMYANKPVKWDDYSDGSKVIREEAERQIAEAFKMALNALKAQEPRVMTEQEMRGAEPGAVIYCEQRDEVRTYLTPLIKYDDGVFENRFLGAEPEATQLPNVRFWTSRPTDEQREATPWN